MENKGYKKKYICILVFVNIFNKSDIIIINKVKTKKQRNYILFYKQNY